jgi:hypothetical protein
MSRLSRRVFAFCLLVVATFFSAGISRGYAENSRVALVIGNGGYLKVPTLPHPPSDASDMADALERMGFVVTRLIDGNLANTRKVLADFGEVAERADTAVVFYAGHGLEASGENWLIPVDAETTSDADARSRAISVRELTRHLDRARVLGLIILDACRDNPFSLQTVADTSSVANQGGGPTKTPSISHGLAPVNPTGNVLIAFAAKDGTVAQDGDGRNSPFTSALLRHIEQPGVEVSFLFRIVRDEVMKATGGAQQPFVYGSLSRESIYLKPPTSDQMLAVMPTIAPETRPSNPLFSADDTGLIEKIGRDKQFNMPPYQIDAIDSDVPDKLKRFVGVWVSRIGNGNGTGRQVMLIVSHVDKEGTASGYVISGPPTRTAWSQAPASYTAFKSKIGGDTLQFQVGKAQEILRLTENDQVSYHIQMGERSSWNTLYPVWRLAASEAGKSVDTSALPVNSDRNRMTGRGPSPAGRLDRRP